MTTIQSIQPIERVIWSADVTDEAALMDHLDSMPDLRIVKIDSLFVTETGLGIVDRLNERGLLVFDDAKIIEVPSKVAEITQRHLAHRPFMLSCMAGALSTGFVTNDDPVKIDCLKRFADACHEAGTKPCGVTVLTSKAARIVRDEFNDRNTAKQTLYYAEMLLKFGFTDLICSPAEVDAIRSDRRFDTLDLITPGIRPIGFRPDDQARTDTPEATLAAGATRLVIGRPITLGNPSQNLDRIVASIAAMP